MSSVSEDADRDLVPPPPYRIVRRLGEGGMGVVYEAFDEERAERVALKALTHASPDALVRFKREFRALQDIHHPNLVTLGSLGSIGDRWFFTMELVDGVDFLEYVRPPLLGALGPALDDDDDSAVTDATMPFQYDPSAPPTLGQLDEQRLRAVLPQLVDGLVALHAANKVHRDIKPSNIRVTPEGRVVVLDFGLVLDTMSTSQSLDLALVGTPAYMAPEQAASDDIGPPADWYAVGVLLYEALTGRLPFEGTPLEIFMRKQRDEPLPPSQLAPGVPEDLERLAMRLLRFEPAKRPDGVEILRRLYVPATSRASFSSHSSLGQTTFVGRRDELDALGAALRDSRHTGVHVTISGASGIGKSLLVRQFTEELATSTPDAVVLAGRCYERETSPFKAVDGAVDALSRYLSRVSAEEARAFVPLQPAPLVQVFPVLRRSEAIAKRAGPATPAALDPQELRRRAFATLREILRNIGAAKPLVLAIDDFHWTDDDSLALLRELLRSPDAPCMLLVTTARLSGSTGTDGSLRDVRRQELEALPGDEREVSLTALSDADAFELARRLLERSVPEKLGVADTIAREAAGHPLFIDELVRHAAMLDGEAREGSLTLDDALSTRIRQLETPARRIIELVAVAGAPMRQETIARAAELSAADFDRRASLLRVANLVRTSGGHGTDTIEPLHGRVSRTVLAHLDQATQRSHHERLALALEALPSPDAQALARHWRGAKDPDRAATYAILAGDRADAALAFLRATRFYQLALELLREDDPRVRVVHEKLGNTFSNAGRGAAAAVEYEEAARGAPAAHELELRRRAAEQLLRSGHFDDGMIATRAVLAAVGLKLPGSPRAALVHFVFFRLLLLFRGFRFEERDATVVSAKDLTRIDTCWSVSFSLALSDHIYGALFQARMMLFSLRAGEPKRVSRALSLELAYKATRGGRLWVQAQKQMARAQALAERTRDPHAIGFFKGASGMAHYVNGSFVRALDLCDRGTRQLREEVAGAAWEAGASQLFAMNSLFYLGRLSELRVRQQSYLRDALERGDLYATVNCRIGLPSFVWLAADDPASARKHATKAMAEWSKRGFHLEHFYELLALTNVDLYEGRAVEAFARILERWPALQRSLLPRIQSLRILSWQMRARAALAVAGDGVERGAHLKSAAADARRIAATGAAWSGPLVSLIDAGVAHRRGRTARALSLLERAARDADACEMALFAALARRAQGSIVGGDAGDALVARAEGWMRGETVRSPARVARVWTPGFDT